MKHVLKYGILIGVVCALWTFIMGFLGWYKDPVLLNMFWLVIIFEIIILVLGLKKTAPENTYGQQVLKGSLMAVIGSVIIFLGSILFTTIVFPNYFNELQELNRQLLAEAGKTPDEIDTLVKEMSAAQTPFFQALSGMFGTIFTGILASLIISAIYKKKN